MAALALDEATERVAVNLLRHLEWQADGFSLVFLFADVGPSLQMADWLDERLALQDRPLRRADADAAFVSAPDAAVDALISRLAAISAQPGACWFAVQRHPSDESWNRARRLFLARLNERRFLLERDLARPLVLVLPADFRAEARNIAPDIWHVRALSEELRASAAPVVEGSAPRAKAAVTADLASPTPSYDEWQRMVASAPDAPERWFLPTAGRAVAELLGAGRPADADEVARAALAAARQQAAKEDTNSALREVSIALDNVGRVAQAQGDLAQAESTYRESLALSRQLVERLGGTPEALRDVSVALDNVGRVAEVQGDWAQAESAYRESLALRRQLVERLGGTPEALRDVSVALNNVGRVAEVQGDLARAESAYRESLALSRQLVERLGGTPDALDDLAVSLLNVAESAPGDTALRAEATAIYEGLAARFPDVHRYAERLAALRGDNAGTATNAPATPN